MGYRPKMPELSDNAWVNTTPAYGTTTAKLKFSLWPRKCYSSKKNIWLKKAYRVCRDYPSYNDEYYSEYRWYDPQEFTKLRLMG